MGSLQNYNPFGDVWNLSDEVSRLLWGLEKSSKASEKRNDWLPAVDITEDKEAVKIHAEIPGIKKEDLKINIRDSVLTLSGERKFHEEKKKDNYYRLERSYGAFSRSFSLPNTVDGEKIQANLKDGVLEVYIPKKPEAKEKEIDVKVG